MFRFLYGRWKPKKGKQVNYFPISSDSSMVDENRTFPDKSIKVWSGSDSSMVDENRDGGRGKDEKDYVQIPLWSMKTVASRTSLSFSSRFRFLYGRWKPSNSNRSAKCFACSDSSMVDENPGWGDTQSVIAGFRFLYGRWKRAESGIK
mgnify:CR=1 FL=1